MVDVRQLFETVPEDQNPISAHVTGLIPSWLKGSFLRVGPGRYELDEFKVNSWLDGYSLLSTFDIDDNKVTFRRRYLQSDAYKKATKAKKPIYTEFATRNYPDPNKGLFARMVSSVVPGDMTDNGNLNCFQMQGRLVAATETCFLRVVNPDTLDTLDKVDLSKMAGVHMSTCHPHVTSDGTVYNIGCNFFSGLKYTIYKTPPADDISSQVMSGTKTIGTVSPSWKTNFGYFHSFGLTTNYLVFVEQPLLVNSLKLLASQAKGKSFKECLDWTPDEKVTFVVIDRQSGQRLRTTYKAETFFFLHHINAYEEDDHLVVDLVAFERPPFEKFSFEYIGRGYFEANDPPTPKRFVLPLPSVVDKSPVNSNMVTLGYTEATAEKQKNGVVHLVPENIFDGGSHAGFDLPNINYAKCNGKPYRYVFGTGFFEQQQTMNSLCKGDVKTRQIQMWSAGEGFYPGEPIFVASPGAQGEDEGVIICGICSGNPEEQDFMVILDAKTFEELARATVSERITLAAHGRFIPK